MALTENEKRYWRGYFERKAAEKEEVESSAAIASLQKELAEVKKQLKKKSDEHFAREHNKNNDLPGIVPFLVGCALGIFIA